MNNDGLFSPNLPSPSGGGELLLSPRRGNAAAGRVAGVAGWGVGGAEDGAGGLGGCDMDFEIQLNRPQVIILH